MKYTENTRQQGMKTRDRILEAIKTYIAERSYPPTVREICDMTEISSTSTVNNQMHKMFADGTLETDAPGAPRAIRVPGMRMIFERADAEA